MISYRSPFRTVVPTSLEKRLAVLAAIRAFAAQDGSDRLRRQTEVAALRRDCELLRRLLLGLLQEAMAEARRDCDPRLRSHVIKYSLDQPRVSAGNPDGGQWTSGGREWRINRIDKRLRTRCAPSPNSIRGT